MLEQKKSTNVVMFSPLLEFKPSNFLDAIRKPKEICDGKKHVLGNFLDTRWKPREICDGKKDEERHVLYINFILLDSCTESQ